MDNSSQGSFAVYQKQGGAYIALSTTEGEGSQLVKVSREFCSLGRALVAKQALELKQSDEGANAA